MAKGNMLMNQASGKLGSMVFYRANGEQRTRTYTSTVKNPKTASQMGQRTQLSNLVQMYRTLSIVLKKAFTDKNPKQSDYNAFVSRNLGYVSIFIPKEMAKAQGCVVAPYQISSGSIAAITVTGIGVAAVTNLALGEAFTIDENTTVGDLSQALISNNNDLVAGMQLSYISVIQNNNVQSGYPQCNANMYKMVLDPSNTKIAYSVMPKQAIAAIQGYLGHGDFVADGAFCWILSQKDAKGTLQVSPQKLIVTSNNLYQAYSDDAAKTNAGVSYGETPDPFLVPYQNSINEPTNVMAVASVSIKGEVVTQGGVGDIILSVGDAFTINGTNLDDTKMSIYFNDTADKSSSATVIGGAVPISEALSDVTSTPTSIAGKIVKIEPYVNQIAIVGNGRILYWVTLVPSESPDPTA